MTQAEPGEVHLLGVGAEKTKQSSRTNRPSTLPGHLQPADTSNYHQIWIIANAVTPFT